MGDPGRGTCMPGCMAWGGEVRWGWGVTIMALAAFIWLDWRAGLMRLGLVRVAGLARRTPSPEVPATGMGAVLTMGEDPGVASRIMLELAVAGCRRLPRG